MNRHGKGGEHFKKGPSSRTRNSNDSLKETDSNVNTLSGGMGERKTTSEESRQGFADDERESHQSFFISRSKTSVNKCRRCQVELSTKARYCRKCYENRENWMPLRPTRRKRRRAREPDQRSFPRSVRSLERTDWDQLFKPAVNYRKGPRGEGLHLSGPEFSNLPQFARRRASSSSSASSGEFKRERLRQWMRRRAVFYYCGNRPSSSGSPQQSRCQICRYKPADAFIVHGRTAHDCACQDCARALLARRGKCPQCESLITGISKKQ